MTTLIEQNLRSHDVKQLKQYASQIEEQAGSMHNLVYERLLDFITGAKAIEVAIDAFTTLDNDRNQGENSETKRILRAIMGGDGYEILRRFGLMPGTSLGERVKDQIERELWNSFCNRLKHPDGMEIVFAFESLAVQEQRIAKGNNQIPRLKNQEIQFILAVALAAHKTAELHSIFDQLVHAN